MADGFESSIRAVMSGEARGVRASLMRAGLLLAEPFYRAIVGARNVLFDLRLRKPYRLPVPVISVGNLTTGGTGKTPLVAWLVEKLHHEGDNPAILMRGYRKSGESISDEVQYYLSTFSSMLPRVQVLASPRRRDAALESLRRNLVPTVFVLDDGFQHRQLARDFDLVLIDATNPFGYGHVLPRGMLRESAGSIRRADAVLITRADQVESATLLQIRNAIASRKAAIPIFQCSSELEVSPSIASRKAFAFCGIGNPDSFWLLLKRAGVNVLGTRALGDHQAYTPELIAQLGDAARTAGAESLVTTEKDWTKVQPLAHASPVPIFPIAMQLRFSEGDDAKLLDLIRQVVKRK